MECPTLLRTRPGELERRLRARLDTLGSAPRAELLHVLMLPDLERAERIGEFWSYPQSRTFAELLIDAHCSFPQFSQVAHLHSVPSFSRTISSSEEVVSGGSNTSDGRPRLTRSIGAGNPGLRTITPAH